MTAQATDGRHAEDFTVGEECDLGTYEVTEQEVIAFASHWDPQDIHIDPGHAETGGRYGGLIASGLHTLAILQRLQVLGRREHWNVIAGQGIDRLRFRRPVRPGDVLSGHSRVIDVRLEPEWRRGLVVFDVRALIQEGKEVLTMEMAAYLEMRSEATAGRRA